MNAPFSPHHQSLGAQLLQFVGHTLPAVVPVALWWAGALAVFSVLNLALEQEIWPNTPQAVPVLVTLLIGSLVATSWQLAVTSRRLTKLLPSGWCWGFWKLVTIGCYLAIAGELVVAFFVLLFTVTDILF